MLGLVLESTLRTGTWVVGQGINGISYLIYGSPEEKVIRKLERLENQINALTNCSSSETEDQRYYWMIKKSQGFDRNSWVVIANQKLILNTESKSQALRAIADFQEENQLNQIEGFRCLLIQVGQENNCFYL
jgi:hypothetical protein